LHLDKLLDTGEVLKDSPARSALSVTSPSEVLHEEPQNYPGTPGPNSFGTPGIFKSPQVILSLVLEINPFALRKQPQLTMYKSLSERA
jgi:hypothetical protein